ncbi:glycosyltransferase family 4 protein [Eubacterium limosum]|uniref:Glycosyltransferase family 4 protein n=1 Tax=Eubacterium limosum TaxID=1736 RepID=A0ABT5UM91_EUBLI|nr:glycosyltransferase family 4 protein [Eubacterium limosum]MCB6568172.1 glycosyltransferase family 4 protein [Eubacterium limosum]MDE1470041.1 glycosyltransferase family 4 protein [Eubacterium limosum]
MKKVLLVTTVSGFVPQFQMHNVNILQKMGYEVHYAANYNIPSYGNDNNRLDGTGIVRHQIDFARSPYTKQTIIAYKQLKQLMKKNRFDLIHCHTPMGGALARLAAKNTNTKPVIYSVHGFHFYKGAPIQNFLIYQTMEKYFAHYTDVLITTNHEDYQAAQKFKMKENGKVYFVPGVGIEVEKFKNLTLDKRKLRKNLGISEETIILLSVGEVIKRKNHETVIKAMEKLKRTDIVYLICGQGELEEKLKNLTDELGLQNKVKFLGYQEATPYYHMANIFLHPSYREGLSRALMEAMAVGLPIICSKIRGNVDLVDNKGGRLIEVEEIDEYAKAILELSNNPKLRNNMSTYNLEKINQFDISNIDLMMEKIYKKSFD